MSYIIPKKSGTLQKKRIALFTEEHATTSQCHLEDRGFILSQDLFQQRLHSQLKQARKKPCYQASLATATTTTTDASNNVSKALHEDFDSNIENENLENNLDGINVMCLEAMEVSREEAKRILRRLELEAYSSIVSTFRAQGDLNREKKKLLTDLGVHLSISTERHRAEVRRAYSDDRLGAVADCIVGPSTCSEWAAEGRRLVPLMPRLVPQTILSGTATASANAASAANAQITSQVKKTAVGSTAASTCSKEASLKNNTSPSSLVKPSPVKQLARQNSETVDVEYDSDDNKAKKKRKLSQSIPSTKPAPKILLNPASAVNKQGTKTASVSTSTMTKVGKQPSAAGTVKAAQKLMLPASASQVKLLTRTVSITQTVSQTKTMLNYKTVAATSPAAVKVQTVMSHTVPKPQVKVAVPSVSKNVLVPKTNVSTSPSKAVTGISPLKTGITMSQLAAKQKVKQTTRFKPVAGTVKYKSVTPAAAMDTTAAVNMVTATSSNITTLTGSTISSIPNTQPVVRVIQVPSTGGITKPMIVMTTGPTKATPSVSSGTSVLKIPISTTPQTSTVPSTTLVGRNFSQAATKSIPSSAKTVVMSTIVGGTKKVVLSVPAPVIPIQAKPNAIVASTTKSAGLGSQPSGDVNKLKADKPAGKITTVQSLECTEPSGFLKTPAPVIPKTAAPPTISSQVRPRPLQALLPAPPKPVTVAPPTSLPGAPGARKLPQILPAPAKTTVLVPMATPTTQTVCTATVTSSPAVSALATNSKMSMVQLMTKSNQPPVVSKLSVAKPIPSSSTSVALPGSPAKQPQQSGLNQHKPSVSYCAATERELTPLVVSDDTANFIPKNNVSLSNFTQKEVVTNKDGSTNDDKPADQDTLKAKGTKVEGDSNTSSEDDSILVCSETIDSGAGLQDAPLTPEEVPLIPLDRDTNITSSPLGSLPAKSTNSRPVLGDALEKCVTEFLSGESIANFPAKNMNTPGISESSKILNELFSEPDPVYDLQRKAHVNPEKKTDIMSEDNDFEKLKQLNQESTVNIQEEDELKSLTLDDVKDFEAVSSFLQSFVEDNESGQNLSTKESSENSSISSGSLDCKELLEVNQEMKYGQKNEIATVFQQHNQEEKMTLQISSDSSSKSLDMNDIPVMVTSNILTKSEENSQYEVKKDGFGLKNIHVPMNNDEHSLKDFPQSLYDCNMTSSERSSLSQTPLIFPQSSVEQNLSKNLDQHKIKGLAHSSNELRIKDFTQRSLGPDIVDNMMSQSSTSEIHEQGLTESEKLALEAIANVRTSGRKRKPPSILTLSPPRQSSGWIRGALSLLQKVCSYRGQGRKKGDFSAVSWFLRPVDPNEAPGYFKVIKTPMDFGTIKSKLEAGMYQDYVEFHDDMVLIKTNCFKYNPPGHDIRKDCEEVFHFFDTEYEKMLERWEKCHVSPAKKPRTMPKSEIPTSLSC